MSRADPLAPAPARGDGNGFTLIEVMVALAVFSLAALALIRLEGATARGAATVEEALVANLVAHDVAIDAVTGAAAPTAGTVAGVEVNGGRAWRWTRVVAPTANPRIVRVDVAVLGSNGNVVGRTTMVRPPDRPDVPRTTPLNTASPPLIASPSPARTS